MRLFAGFMAPWLLLFSLTSSVAWACAECADLTPSTASFVQDRESHPTHLWSGDRCEDRCGHAVAHVIGINGKDVSLLFFATDQEHTGFGQISWYSVFQSPPYHPPIG